MLLGVSHDAGYAPFLDEVLRDDTTRQKITVLEGYPTVREIVATGVRTLRFQDLFRTEKLVDKAGQLSTYPVLASAPSAGASYANVTQNASPPPSITLPLALKNTVNATVRVNRISGWNPGRRGLDEAISVNPAALDSIKKRKDSNKLCNNHYLRGPCIKGDSCCFEHNYKPSQDEIKAIAMLARMNPCTNGQDCEVEDCIYGHHVSTLPCSWALCSLGRAVVQSPPPPLFFLCLGAS